jgi:hypothetical protein
MSPKRHPAETRVGGKDVSSLSDYPRDKPDR